MPATDGHGSGPVRGAAGRRLERAVRRLLTGHGGHTPVPEDAGVEVRLRHLEEGLAEVRSRVNALFFAVLGSLALEVVGKVTL